MAILSDTQPPVTIEENKLRGIFQLCWDRLKKVRLGAHSLRALVGS
jgi:hypothetical protein